MSQLFCLLHHQLQAEVFPFRYVFQQHIAVFPGRTCVGRAVAGGQVSCQFLPVGFHSGHAVQIEINLNTFDFVSCLKVLIINRLQITKLL